MIEAVMYRIIGGADVSGHGSGDAVRYISLLLGTPEAINAAYNKLEIDGIHMRVLTDSQKAQIREKIDLRSTDIRAWCIHARWQYVERHILDHPKLKKYFQPKKTVHKNFDNQLLDLIRGDHKQFLDRYGCGFHDVCVQTDADMSNTISHWSMKRGIKGRAYELADIMAWYNQKGIRVRNCIGFDWAGAIKDGMADESLRG